MSRSIKLSLALAVFAVVLIPVAAVASHQFTDVPDGNIFHDDIAWMADNNVTKGCNPPANDRYCPSNTVTREQMAAFMHRLAVNKVVDAKTATNADNAANADNADMLDGENSSAYVTTVFGVQKAWDFTTGVIPTTPSFGELLTVSHVAPSSGFVSLTYSATLNYSSVSTPFLIGVAIDDQTCASVNNDTFAYGSIDPATAFDNVASSTILAVSAGSHTYSLCANTLSGDVALVTASIQGLFATDGATATVPLGSSATSPQSPYGDE